jgi:predicted phage terminase large subunit-like protein
VAITRLAQKVDGLRNKAFYDCNPPSDGHWTHKLFIQKRDPSSGQPIRDPDGYAAFGPMNPTDNAGNLSADYLKQLEGLSERDRRRFLLGQWGSANEAALWTVELLEQSRFEGTELPEMARVIVAVDPSGASGKEDERSDEIGIVVCGLGTDGKGYVLEDLSGRMGPADWGRAAVSAFDRYQADAIVAEVNFGGEMVAEVIRSAAREGGAARPVPFREVRASRGKAVRAEPIATLFEQEKVRLAGIFPVLEDQLCAMTTAGFVGDRSPDRADAMIWGLAHLFPAMTRRDDEFRAPPKVVLGYAGAKRAPGSPQPRVVLSRR